MSEGMRICVRARGPLVVKGPCVVEGIDGTLTKLAAGESIRLCRCGASRTAPVCDSSHYRVAWKDDARVASE